MAPAAQLDQQDKEAEKGHSHQVTGQPHWEAGEVGHNQTDVGAPEGQQDGRVVGRLPRGLGRLAVAEEGVEQAARQHADLTE